MSKQTMFAVKRPTGEIIPWTIRGSEGRSRECFAESLWKPWNKFYDEGYRCVRVTVREVQDVR